MIDLMKHDCNDVIERMIYPRPTSKPVNRVNPSLTKYRRSTHDLHNKSLALSRDLGMTAKLSHTADFGGLCTKTSRNFQTTSIPVVDDTLFLRTLCQPHNAIMATELTVQSERAYQKQPHIFLNHKSKAAKSRRVGKGGRRWYKDVGLGFRTPKTAIEGSYIG